jgi:hypothetical protein
MMERWGCGTLSDPSVEGLGKRQRSLAVLSASILHYGPSVDYCRKAFRMPSDSGASG